MSNFERVSEVAISNEVVAADGINDIILEIPLLDPDQRWLWLSLPYCGFTTEVSRQLFEQNGIPSQGIINRNIEGRQTFNHTLLAVGDGEEITYVDHTYMQMLAMYGLDAHLVAESWDLGTGDVLPKEHTLIYKSGEVPEVVSKLTALTLGLLSEWQQSEAWAARDKIRGEQPKLKPSEEEMTEFYRRVYDPSYFGMFSQKPEKIDLVSEYLRDYSPGQISVTAFLKLFTYRAVKSQTPAL